MQAKADWGIDRIPIGFGLAIEDARDWGLYISTTIRDGETPIFTEPGLFLIEADGTLRLAVLNSDPHLRPDPD
ncbi:MAG: AhpC/TSA family protein, partial [Desulfuromonadales bacterium]|nr:AhpC/TSA family protein [Desulfuromonadales bacterium]